ncbi:NAD-dependent epimerase/dehydratase family protein [Xylanibacillus composti]|uniref:Capsular polysaccharide biosynthesis protein Cap8F n=1 Tax=Xylanibacillus composti TaxID=1572762 RepID=A0A8J4H5C0_9BACL|nr:capsular polysaccharide biosynthesis protein CapF [Xylanibacillus composti]MDT9725939.1 NAD-dependent epimerase/dehydratase family protein [Xylanibacillus composti]GIQ71252.1 capsular polysaccharide biosynthesis protein Cap8F [Xylanibacillus composti]
MKVLVTGAKGFIGRNLLAHLKSMRQFEIYEYNRESETQILDVYCQEVDFVFHLAGVNRPEDESDYMKGNFEFTLELLNRLEKYGNTCPILMSSSIQAQLNNSYGISKKASENLLFQYGEETGARVLVYRLPNVFGKWCKPNYNSVVATFCYNIARELEVKVSDPLTTLNLVYIDDVIHEFIRALHGKGNFSGKYYEIPSVHQATLGQILDLIRFFKESRQNRYVPKVSNSFEKQLYSTYLSYLPTDKLSYKLKMNKDDRGSFTEFLKTPDRGQVSVNISGPGITKGNHWHHTKVEKFLVVKGEGVIRFRQIGSTEIIEYYVNGDELEVVDIPPGYTHNIENIGESDMVTIMWANEEFDPEKSDTYFSEV